MTGRILFFADAQSVHTRRWVGEIAARGYDCLVATRRPAEVPGAREVIAVRPGGDGPGWFAALPEVRRLARRVQPDWVHGHYVTSYGLWAAACGRRPVVLTAWGSDILVTPRQSRWMRALVGWTLRRADLITADSQDMLEEIRRYGPRAPLQEVLWGADTDHFRPADPAREAGPFTILSLRNWEPNYRIDTLLRAFAALRRERPQAQARLLLLGGGPDAEALRGLAAALGVSDAVDFTGRVDDTGMQRAFQAAQVSVSVPASDATSVSLLESMACGLAVVVSDLPANRQWIDERGGLRVPAGDAEALAQALVRLFDHPQARQAMGQHNRQVAVARASRRTMMDRMDGLYRSLRPGPRPTKARPR